MEKKSYINYVEDCQYQECETKGNCKGCYQEYLNEKDVVDPSIHDLIIKWKMEDYQKRN